ncbi:MAG: spore germination protein [Firmicutes bacterium]|nr:spore germination protein [Bacillota bacterium]
MDLTKIIKSILTFKEPRVEPEFVLAWDEPAEINGQGKKAASQSSGQFDPETAFFPGGAKLTGNLEKDAGLILEAFGGVGNQLLGRRELCANGSSIIVFFIRRLVNPRALADKILGPLSRLGQYNLKKVSSAITGDWVESTENLEYGLRQLRQGKSLILIENEKKIILAEAGQAAHRQVSPAINERVIIGPQEGFTEDLATNLALIQKRYRSQDLQMETMEVGAYSHTQCVVVSVKGLTNPRLLAEVKRRIAGVKISHLTDSGMLAQLIEDNLWNPYPQILATERPDRIAAALDEGKVVVAVDGSHLVLAMPATVLGLLHSAEDYCIRWPYGVYLRLIRILGAFVITFLPAFYVAVNLYQPELVPTDMLLSLVAIKIQNPFPTIVELIIVTLILEILREAGFRGASKISGPLIIIIGFFLGMLSLFANLINPVLLSVIALTGISTFLMPEYSVSMSFQLISYLYTLFAFIYGFIGIAFSVFLHLHILAKQKSFGAPMLAPIGPITSRSGDVLLMRSITGRKSRPDFFDALKRRRQPQNTQTWKEAQNQPENAPEVEE